MAFRQFNFQVIYRVVLLTLVIALSAYFIFGLRRVSLSLPLIAAIIFQIVELLRFITRTNRKLTRFFESVKYSDFVSGFNTDNSLGSSFRELNTAISNVMDAFRKARSEKEEHWQYLKTVVEHVSTGLLSFDKKGDIQLFNPNAKEFLRTPQIRNIEEIESIDSKFLLLLREIEAGGQALYRLDDKTNLVVHATLLRLKKKEYKLVAMQNIQSELQQKEIESWQNLTRVLRHEIMNSMTPIASLTSTLNDILTEELDQKDGHFEISGDGIDDIHEGLKTIEGRSKALINFINAYRDYTTIPPPNPEKIIVSNLLEEVHGLMKIDIRKKNMKFAIYVDPPDLEIYADQELIQLVLINLVKNAVEAIGQSHPGEIVLEARNGQQGHPLISISDNGKGIIDEALDKIFIPFYTTKSMGSGIGLALSRQIMQLHNGSLTVNSSEQQTTFNMQF